MPRNPGYVTWRRSRACRLPQDYYPEGQLVHVVIRRCAQAPALSGAFGEALTSLLAEDDRVAVACVMPDHVHVVWSVADNLSKQVAAFKGRSTRTLWRFGHEGVLWQRSFFDHVIRHNEDATVVARYILENPVRAGLIEANSVWPLQVNRFTEL